MSSINITAIIVALVVVVNNSCLCQRNPQRGSRRCTADELQKCTHFLESLPDNNDFALPISRDELQLLCDNSRKGVRCLDEHMKLCFTTEQTLVFKDLITPARYFISQLCDTASVQRGESDRVEYNSLMACSVSEFLKYAPCFKNVSVDASKCADKYREAIRVTSQAYATPLAETDSTMRRSCCVLGEFLDCKYHHVLRDCGRDAESFMRNHMEPIINPINRHCSAYTYGTESCIQMNDIPSAASKPMAAISTDQDTISNSSLRVELSVFTFFFSIILSLSLTL